MIGARIVLGKGRPVSCIPAFDFGGYVNEDMAAEWVAALTPYFHKTCAENAVKKHPTAFQMEHNNSPDARLQTVYASFLFTSTAPMDGPALDDATLLPFSVVGSLLRSSTGGEQMWFRTDKTC